ncbi:hypothetical protein F7725_021231 [Dissostichus mawsoni]|uniref:Uncharacterized protein n=1 Tax=Dissostichus mawsoni TaxID=36200 RepID=A0A7J5YGD6_DISMA|nr:hypothetical protein F7725_021231 [Dissostichus mawsoni]
MEEFCFEEAETLMDGAIVTGEKKPSIAARELVLGPHLMNAFSLTAPSSTDRGNALAFESANQINLLLERGASPKSVRLIGFMITGTRSASSSCFMLLRKCSDVQKCLSAPPPLLFILTVQHLLILPLTLQAFWFRRNT